MDTEAILAKLEAEGDPALADFFAQQRPRLRRMVETRLDRRIAGRVDASDILQEAFLDAAKQMPGYLESRPMPPFLWLRFLVGQRLLATHRRHLGARMRDAKLEVNCCPPVSSESFSICLAGRLTTPSQMMARGELQLRVRMLVDALDPLDREILALRHFEELSNTEVADELAISPAAASNRYMRALGRLSRLLADHTELRLE